MAWFWLAKHLLKAPNGLYSNKVKGRRYQIQVDVPFQAIFQFGIENVPKMPVGFIQFLHVDGKASVWKWLGTIAIDRRDCFSRSIQSPRHRNELRSEAISKRIQKLKKATSSFTPSNISSHPLSAFHFAPDLYQYIYWKTTELPTNHAYACPVFQGRTADTRVANDNR